MPENQINSQPDKGENVETNENIDSNGTGERFQSDTQKIVRRHMENEDDIITDEDIRNVRVGMSPPTMDEPTEARFEDEETKDNIEEKYIDKKASKNKEDKRFKCDHWASFL